MQAAQGSGKHSDTGPKLTLAASNGTAHGLHRQNGVPDGGALYRRIAAIGDGLSAHADPYGIAAPILHAQMAWLMHPQELGERIASLSSALWELQWHTLRRAGGGPGGVHCAGVARWVAVSCWCWG